ncbi:MAG: cob(I)yrinic acid a,c-diamide adenosyltransferase [Clostridiales bacterium]
MEQGYVQVYTGNGKGKTTASLGLIMRAVATGAKVYFGQFVKNMEYKEIETLKKRFPEVTTELFGSEQGCFINREPAKDDKNAAKKGYEKAMAALISEKYDVVVLDEINIALYYQLITIEEVLLLIKMKPKATELILTGRYAPPEICEAADLVSEMREEKHYYNAGILARVGIEF